MRLRTASHIVWWLASQTWTSRAENKFVNVRHITTERRSQVRP